MDVSSDSPVVHAALLFHNPYRVDFFAFLFFFSSLPS